MKTYKNPSHCRKVEMNFIHDRIYNKHHVLSKLLINVYRFFLKINTKQLEGIFEFVCVPLADLK